MSDGKTVIRTAAERLADALWKAGMPSEQAYRLAPNLARVFLETHLMWPVLLHNGTDGVCKVLAEMEDGSE